MKGSWRTCDFGQRWCLRWSSFIVCLRWSCEVATVILAHGDLAYVIITDTESADLPHAFPSRPSTMHHPNFTSSSVLLSPHSKPYTLSHASISTSSDATSPTQSSYTFHISRQLRSSVFKRITYHSSPSLASKALHSPTDVAPRNGDGLSVLADPAFRLNSPHDFRLALFFFLG